MKQNPKFFLTARAALSTLLLVSSFFLTLLALSNLSARDRTRGSLRVQRDAPATTRHHFNVPAGQARIAVQVSATVATNDLTMTLLFGADPNPVPLHTEDTGTSTEAYNYQPAGGVPQGEYQVQICQTPSTNGVPQMAPFSYNGTFTYDNTAAGGTPPFFGALSAAPQDSGPKVGYENFEPP